MQNLKLLFGKISMKNIVKFKDILIPIDLFFHPFFNII